VLVNDSPSWKPTAESVATVACANPKLTVVELTRNFGQQPATLCGIEHAKGEWIITMDDDLQHAPEDIPRLLSESDHDAVIACFPKKHHSLFKRMSSHIKGVFDRLILSRPADLELSPFRLIRSSIALGMLRRNTPYPFIPALLFEMTDDVVNVEVEHFARTQGKSHYSFIKMLKLFSNLLINQSSLLLRLVGGVGALFAVGAFSMATWIVIRKLTLGIAISGWASVMTTILFLGGMMLITMGIVGEYLIRIIATTEQRPKYHVRSVRRGEDVEQIKRSDKPVE